jgi:Clostripain family
MKTTTKSFFVALAFTVFSIGAQALPLAEKEWTFLLFLNGHNSLSSFGDSNLIDMEKSGSSDQVNMVVEWGSLDTNLTRRMLVQKSTNPSKVTSPVLMNLKDHDMGDYKNLVNFVKWGAENFPARHYFVAVWNHGSGWHFQEMSNKNGAVHVNDISFDDNTGNKITTEQLGLAMGEIKQIIGRNVDIYGSDACLMAMAEVAAEMKDSVNYFVGSEDLEPGDGWPYAPFMKKWTATPNITPAELAILLSKEYVKSYSPGGVYSESEVTFSALDLSKLDALMNSTKVLSAHIRSLGKDSMKKIKTALSSVQGYYYSDYKDYGDFVKVINALPISKNEKLFTDVSANIKEVVLSADSTPTFKKSTGVSIWIPTYANEYMDRYTGLEFDKQTGWSSFLKLVLAN